jgi:hypothetical protein
MPLACIIMLRLLGAVLQLLRLRCQDLSGRNEIYYMKKGLYVVDQSFVHVNVVLDELYGLIA